LHGLTVHVYRVVAQCVKLLNFSACLEARPQTPTTPLSNPLSSKARRRPARNQMIALYDSDSASEDEQIKSGSYTSSHGVWWPPRFVRSNQAETLTATVTRPAGQVVMRSCHRCGWPNSPLQSTARHSVGPGARRQNQHDIVGLGAGYRESESESRSRSRRRRWISGGLCEERVC
jgi:hypothetical protein